jgi:hypothetical protein
VPSPLAARPAIGRSAGCARRRRACPDRRAVRLGCSGEPRRGSSPPPPAAWWTAAPLGEEGEATAEPDAVVVTGLPGDLVGGDDPPEGAGPLVGGAVGLVGGAVGLVGGVAPAGGDGAPPPDGKDTLTRGVSGAEEPGRDTLTRGVSGAEEPGRDTLTRGVSGAAEFGKDTPTRGACSRDTLTRDVPGEDVVDALEGPSNWALACPAASSVAHRPTSTTIVAPMPLDRGAVTLATAYLCGKACHPRSLARRTMVLPGSECN